MKRNIVVAIYFFIVFSFLVMAGLKAVENNFKNDPYKSVIPEEQKAVIVSMEQFRPDRIKTALKTALADKPAEYAVSLFLNGDIAYGRIFTLFSLVVNLISGILFAIFLIYFLIPKIVGLSRITILLLLEWLSLKITLIKGIKFKHNYSYPALRDDLTYRYININGN